jgi:hypothetical protein
MNDRITLATGASVYANCNIVGIDDAGRTYQGYDQGLRDDDFTAADMKALARLMIERWAVYGGLTVTISEPHEVG